MTRRLTLLLTILLIASVVVDLFLVTHGEGHHAFWTEIPGFFFSFGVIGCVIIIVGSKALGHRFLQKDEGYYEDEYSE